MTENLMCVHRGGQGDENLYWCTFTGTNWTDDTVLNNGAESAAGPGLAVLNGTLYCVHRGRQGDPSLWWSTFDAASQSWSQDTQFTNGNETNVGPALAVYNGVLYCVHKGNSDNNLWWSTFDPGSQTWSEDTQFNQGNQTNTMPTICVSGGTLYCVHTGTEGAMWWCQFDGSNWTEDTQFPPDVGPSTPAGLADYGGNLCCIFGQGDAGLYCMALQNGNWVPGPWCGTATVFGTALAAFNGMLVSVRTGQAAAQPAPSVTAQIFPISTAFSKSDWQAINSANLNFAAFTGTYPQGASQFPPQGNWSNDEPFNGGNLSADMPALAVVSFP
jgi:hypothetical protein